MGQIEAGSCKPNTCKSQYLTMNINRLYWMGMHQNCSQRCSEIVKVGTLSPAEDSVLISLRVAGLIFFPVFEV